MATEEEKGGINVLQELRDRSAVAYLEGQNTLGTKGGRKNTGWKESF